MSAADFWNEVVSEALDEAGIEATSEQIATIAANVESAHENYGMAFYQPENPLIGELSETKAALKAERELVHCNTCSGRGRIYSQGPYHGSDSQCWKCYGNGKHKP
ncbi:MAG TPA: hypothetical protein VF800_02840 [Telluria sp.]|jgi:hypothetical protein